MNHKEAQELLFVDRYLAGKLSAGERSAFESHILACQECLDELQLTDQLRLGFKDAFGDGQSVVNLPASTSGGALLHAPRYATAASVLLAASLLAAGLMYGRQGVPEGPAAAQVFSILSTRSVGVETINQLRLSSPEAIAVLLVDSGPTEYADYSVKVQRDDAAGATAITTLDGLQPTYDNMLAVTIPPSVLPAGDYTIEVSGRHGQDAGFERVTRLRFRVVD